MGLLEQQNVLARLYTDAKFEQDFRADPEKVGDENGLSSNEIADINSIASEELEFFSESLIWKRLREVEKMMPLTRKILGDDFRPAFLEFAPTFNPGGIKKHLEDAVEFCRFLENGDGSELAKDAAIFERTKLTFLNSNSIATFCRLKHDLRPKLKQDDPTNSVKRTSFAVWFRLGGRVRHFIR